MRAQSGRWPRQSVMLRSLEGPRVASARPRGCPGESRCSKAATGLGAQPPASVRGAPGLGVGTARSILRPWAVLAAQATWEDPVGRGYEPGLELCTGQPDPSVGQCPWLCPPAYTLVGGTEPCPPPGPQPTCPPAPPPRKPLWWRWPGSVCAGMGPRASSESQQARGRCRNARVGRCAPRQGPLWPLSSS